MVRPSYSLSADVLKGTDPDKHRIPIFSALGGPRDNLRGFKPLPEPWGIDWGFFFDGLPRPPDLDPATGAPDQAAPSDPLLVPQPSYRIDTVLVDPLSTFWVHPCPRVRACPPRPAWPSATSSGVTCSACRRARPWPDDSGRSRSATTSYGTTRTPRGEQLDRRSMTTSRSSRGAPRCGSTSCARPSCSAARVLADPFGGHHLGPVGGRIVAEVLIGLLWNDHHSYLFQRPPLDARAAHRGGAGVVRARPRHLHRRLRPADQADRSIRRRRCRRRR